MFAITQLKNIFPISLQFKDANVQNYKIVTIQLLSTGVMVPIPKQISWSYGTQTVRNVLQLLITEQKSQNGERTWEKKKISCNNRLVPSSSTNWGLQSGGMLRRRTSDVESALEGGNIMLGSGERLW